jgi:hypothetical protein
MRNKGSSLLYVLVILSFLSVFLTSFIFFTRNRYKILKLNHGYSYSLKKKLVENEKIFSDSVYKSGIFFEGDKIILNNKSEYYNSVIIKNFQGENHIKRLIFFKQNQESIGGFKILHIKDQNGSIYYQPLKENSLYPDLTITYQKNILNEDISFIEEIKFSRKNNDEIIIDAKSFYLKGE